MNLMRNHPFRKLTRLIGLDLHRYRPAAGRLDWLRARQIATVLDIGANIGQFAREIRQVLSEARIISFEPLGDCYRQLTANFANDKNFTALNLALGNKKERAIINKSAYAPSSSLLPMAATHQTLFPHTKEHQTESIEVRRLDDLAPTLKLEKEMLIKVDVQGYEDRVIAGGPQTFADARFVILEIAFAILYEGQPSFDDLYRNLRALNFSYRGSLGQKINPSSGEILSEDLLFAQD
jgi:FkbM family methyltransferase